MRLPWPTFQEMLATLPPGEQAEQAARLADRRDGERGEGEPARDAEP